MNERMKPHALFRGTISVCPPRIGGSLDMSAGYKRFPFLTMSPQSHGPLSPWQIIHSLTPSSACRVLIIVSRCVCVPFFFFFFFIFFVRDKRGRISSFTTKLKRTTATVPPSLVVRLLLTTSSCRTITTLSEYGVREVGKGTLGLIRKT